MSKALPEARLVASRSNYYRLSGQQGLAHLALYQQGAILAIDPSSLLAVENLQVAPTDHVLDLCCAPGAKLTWLALKGATVTGVDLSPERLGATIEMAKRYKLGNVRLFVADGRTFEVPPHLLVSSSRDTKHGSPVKYSRANAPIWSSSAFRKSPGTLSNTPWGSYDKVLVDAQCTHDGSLKHIRKHIISRWKYFNSAHYNQVGLESLYQLQLDLLQRGFALAREGGLVVYSTCSSSRAQNEGIIEKFLSKVGSDAVRVEDPIGDIQPDQLISLSHTPGQVARILPNINNGNGGFFLCVLRKLIKSP